MKTYYIFIYLILSVWVYPQAPNKNKVTENIQRPITTYHLTLKNQQITLDGVTAEAMTINGSIPGPNLEFTEGDLARIVVTNEMKEETSVHWHGLLLPNYQDGVPYLTTPPIKPGTTFTYEIPINQSGTYWYHSHTMLQEQKGVYGSITIQPKERTHQYDKELVVVLSDWTNEDPMVILKNLKRGNEWYQIKKKTAVPLSRVIAKGALGAQIKMWRDRMEGADIADIYYPTFLINGKNTAEYPEFYPGEKVRLRLINASASTYFWVDFGGGNPILIAADGVDVEPVKKDRLLFAIAETYDFIITIPDGKLEVTATAQDGSGHTQLHLGTGELVAAEVISRPNKIAMMKNMASMDMKMGAPALKARPSVINPEKMQQKYGMNMKHENMDQHNMNQKGEDHEHMHHEEIKQDSINPKNMMQETIDQSPTNHKTMADDHHNHDAASPHEMKHHTTPMAMDHTTAPHDSFDYKARENYYNYDFLKALEPTAYDQGLAVEKYLLNLTGNMNRYIWSMNGVPVTEADKIKISKNKVTQITLNNLTMMHHPMHLHGHYFRVINPNGTRSPLKHTVNVAPMQKVTIEFLGEETGDWLFHCHVLYHMMGGMTRIMSYDTSRDVRMKEYDENKLLQEMDNYFSSGTANIFSNYAAVDFTLNNIRNEFNIDAAYGYNKNIEVEASYNRYLNDWVRIYAGINIENENQDNLDNFNSVGEVGVKYFTPYMFNLDISLDHQLKPNLSLEKEFLLFPSFLLSGEYEFSADFGWINDLEDGEDIATESQWNVVGEYMLSRDFSIIGNYHSEYKWGAGLQIKF